MYNWPGSKVFIFTSQAHVMIQQTRDYYQPLQIYIIHILQKPPNYKIRSDQTAIIIPHYVVLPLVKLYALMSIETNTYQLFV